MVERFMSDELTNTRKGVTMADFNALYPGIFQECTGEEHLRPAREVDFHVDT
jgi:hypothetical protein